MNPLTVSALTTHIVALFEQDEQLRDVWVLGEISNWKRAASGHVYFSLKDSGATIAAVMWRGAAQAQSWLPREGDQVTAHGYVGIYPDRGAYQLYVNLLQPAGRGQLYAQFEALKAQLAEEGLFDEARKQPIAAAPRRIGIVTSRDAAALRDILRVLSNRWPLVDVILFPALVQGSEAPAQLANALATANRYGREIEPLQTIILSRGGGSIEDLWAFNDAQVAYAIAASDIPVVTGIGHETDFTIADFVADLRAPTPSAAAAAIVPDRVELRSQVIARFERLVQFMSRRLVEGRRQLVQSGDRLRRLHPEHQLDRQRLALDDRQQRMHLAMSRELMRQRDRVHNARQRLDALSPLRVLARGYSIVMDEAGAVVKSPQGLVPGQDLEVRAAEGEYRVSVSGAD